MHISCKQVNIFATIYDHKCYILCIVIIEMTEVAWHRPWWRVRSPRWRVRNIEAVRGGLWWIQFTNLTKLSKYTYCNLFLSDIWPVHDGIFLFQEHVVTIIPGRSVQMSKHCLRYHHEKNVSVLRPLFGYDSIKYKYIIINQGIFQANWYPSVAWQNIVWP